MPTPVCPKCQGAMSQGFIMDQNMQSGTTVSTWQEGAPQRSFWTGIKRGPAEQHQTITYRCNRCGFLESYAPA
jgi:hypothetical protein